MLWLMPADFLRKDRQDVHEIDPSQRGRRPAPPLAGGDPLSAGWPWPSGMRGAERAETRKSFGEIAAFPTDWPVKPAETAETPTTRQRQGFVSVLRNLANLRNSKGRAGPVVHRRQIRRHEIFALRQACDLAGPDMNIEKAGAMFVLGDLPYPRIRLEERIKAPRFTDPDGAGWRAVPLARMRLPAAGEPVAACPRETACSCNFVGWRRERHGTASATAPGTAPRSRCRRRTRRWCGRWRTCRSRPR